MWSRSLISSGFRQAARPVTRQTIARPAPFLTTFQNRWLSAQTKEAIEKAVGSAPVVLFMKGTPELPQCGFSRASIQILGLQGVDPEKFAAFNVLEDAELRSGIKEFSDWPTIPQLYIDKEFVGGCDILVSMHQDGSLAKMLEEKNVLAAAEGAEGESKE
ncbi:Monothiol glutaredoxin-5 [Pestalotiopsis fici W106-1]|uniref:Monothiol glutaredoxin-5, mitochondrial n=1 Tax=Pestalotiopsis fici (strain W106-1 / CGMCC3.15140) TaxID=1229662 RepID=W3X7I9_PESFW|nr:Monothiol glutaredoxin-5 [Pestalotiopsis fici W106-1]ETS81136.1 Monothiol glutaredoxin-5 [Pestalotiopsis fici W106-1]